MRVFVTGASGYIGLPVVRELMAAGHRPLAMARSDSSAAALVALGAEVHRGSLEDPDSLRRGAAASDAVIHLAFIHDFARFAENGEIDRRAIETLGEALAGSERPLLVTGGTGGLSPPGQLLTESDAAPKGYRLPRVSEQTSLGLLARGVRASVMRLPQVHDTRKAGLVSYLAQVARGKGVSAYVDDGRNRWPAAHVSDVACLYRLALEQNQPGARYHAVAEEGVAMRDIAEALGRGLRVPVVSISPEQAAAHFGWLAPFAGLDMPASSAQTRSSLGWSPTGPGLLADLAAMDFG